MHKHSELALQAGVSWGWGFSPLSDIPGPSCRDLWADMHLRGQSLMGSWGGRVAAPRLRKETQTEPH